MTNVSIEFLRQFALLEGAGRDVLQQLAAAAQKRDYSPGQTIVREGSTGGDVFIIVDGLVEVVKEGGADEIVLARRGPGQMFGEMGLLDGRPRSATIRALAPTTLLELSEASMRSLLVEQPQLLYRTMQVLSTRLRESDQQMITDLQRKNQELACAYRQLQEAQAALVEKERLERELELARGIQHSFLPVEFPRLPGFECAARYRPARQVGGDFYDVIHLGGQRIGLVMADVSDKGLAAALYMALTRSLIRAEARRSPSPQQVLLSVHKLLLEISQADMFVTVFYGILDLAQRTFCYTRAGHDRPLHLRPARGDSHFLGGDGMALGFVEEVELEEIQIGVETGDALVLYTDGITDASSSSGELFGLQRLHETALAASAASASDLCDLVFARVEQFQAGAVQYDDMALLVVRTKARG
jgi:sigma-B regulation protein RsbU (phosphoserine phosphatase)